MPADSILHAFTLSPALPRLGGGSTWVAVLQDVMIIDCNRLETPVWRGFSGILWTQCRPEGQCVGAHVRHGERRAKPHLTTLCIAIQGLAASHHMYVGM